MGIPDFTRIEWIGPRELSIGEWTFKQHPHDGSGIPLDTTEWLWLFKSKDMLDEYERAFEARPGFVADHVLELGIWAGGSVAYWNLITQPSRLSAVDISDRGDPALLERFRASHPGVTTHWQTSQADEVALGQVVREDGLVPLDLVIDDASHLYGLSRRSFEILFGMLRPGGLYCLEDWNWSFDAESLRGDSELATQKPLVRLVYELIDLMGSQPNLVRSIAVHPLFVIVERGPAPLRSVDLDDLIRRRERPTLQRRVAQMQGKLRREASSLTSRIRSRH